MSSRENRQAGRKPPSGARARLTAAPARAAITTVVLERPDLRDDPRTAAAVAGRDFWREFLASVLVLAQARPSRWDTETVEGDGIKHAVERIVDTYVGEPAVVFAAIHVGLHVEREDDDLGRPRFWLVTVSRKWWRTQEQASLQPKRRMIV